MTRRILLALCTGTLTPLAQAQCPNTTWTGQFGSTTLGLNANHGYALQVFDPDGPGPMPPEFYVGGSFITAGGITTKGLARWNGNSWSDVGGGMGTTSGNPYVSGLGLHDPDGPGPALPVLVVAGRFNTAGTTPAENFAAWNGQAWTALGSGFSSIGNVSFADYDADGAGPELPMLIAASQFQSTTIYPSYLKWDGAQWTEFAPGPPWPTSIAVFDEDGPGPNPPFLFSGLDNDPGIIRWTGSSWVSVGGGLSRSAEHRCVALCVVDEDGPGPGVPVLYAGGTFSLAGGTQVNNIARWDGQAWSPVANGVPSQVEDIIAVPNPAGGPTLYTASAFSNGIYSLVPGQPQWMHIGTGSATFGIFTFHRLAAFDDDGPGPQPSSIYFAATALYSVNNTPSRGIARYGCTSCYANCDGSIVSPSLNVNDFICFMNRFAAGDSYANCDGSTTPPAMNVNDFVCFLNRFAAGCP